MSRIEIRNLVINIPPGTLKSLLVNVFWPAWEWIERAPTKFIYFSYDSSLVGARDGGKMVDLLNSQWYKERWGVKLLSPNPSSYNFDNTSGGFRFASSPGAKGTGRHGNIVVIDDPVKPPDESMTSAITLKALQRVSAWWGGRAVSRQADPKTHRQLLIMQRVHHGDLAGEFIGEGWTLLRFPMRFESSLRCSTAWGGDRRKEDGELLIPQRFGEQEVKSLERGMGPTIASAQLQQRPNVKAGGIFKRAYWQFWHYQPDIRVPCLCDECFDKGYNPDCPNRPMTACEVLPDNGYDFTSWDMAFKGLDTSDFVSSGTWRAISGKYFLLDIGNERMGFADSKRAVMRRAIRWPSAGVHLVEDKANGPAVVDELKSTIPGLELVNPEGGKESRAAASEAPLADLRVFVPHPALDSLTWTLLQQAEQFPNAVNDDLVDMMTQALIHVRAKGLDMFHEAMAAVRHA
jgi:predicted phage terminase large subunit-like protein